MRITNKFRLYPNKEQEEKLLWTLEKCRETYNFLLSELQKQSVIDKSQIQGIIPDMKICEPKLKQVYSKTLQYECYRLFSNLKALSRLKENGKRVGMLRFKGKGCFKTFTYNQSGFKIVKTGKRLDRLHLSKIGDIPIRIHRKIKGKIKQVTIKKGPSGKWFASMIAEINNFIKRKPINKVVGIDLGLIDIVYDSDGRKMTNPKHLKEYSKRLVYLQRRLSRKKKRSSNRNRARIKVARQYEKLKNTRDDFLHKLSRYYIDNYDAIGMEDLQIDKMVKHPYLSKSISDASWGKLRQFIDYKAKNAGKLYVPINHKGTTQRCSQCRKKVEKKLWNRKHKCPFCGFVASRDYNSALEIKKLTLTKIGQGLSESTPVEMIGCNRLSKREATPLFFRQW